MAEGIEDDTGRWEVEGEGTHPLSPGGPVDRVVRLR